MICWLNQIRLIEGYPVDGRRIFITHQLFIDDLILIGKTSISEVPLVSEDSLINYLGVLIGVRKLRSKDWMPFLEKIKGKLAHWPHRFLNLAGRKIIFQSTLAQIPNYLAFLILAPKSVLRALRSVAINFIWSPKVGEQATYCLVGWDKVTTPLWKGGLGIRDPYFLADVRGEKREDMRRGTQPRRSGSEAWKLIVKHWEEVVGRTFPSPGHEGSFVSPWGSQKDADKLNEELLKVELKLGNTTLARTEGLRYGSKALLFELRRFYENIHERILNPRMRPYPVRWHWIWWQLSQNKHNHIHWRLAHKAFIFIDTLHKWRVVGPTTCQMCMQAQPDLNHLWWQCPKIRALWKSILEIFCIEREGSLLDEDSNSIHPFLINRSWEGLYQWFPDEPPTQTIWRIVFKTALYTIWTTQMQAFFNNQKFSTYQTLGKIISQT
eukprot:Gb_16797 [translate_table: standard]